MKTGALALLGLALLLLTGLLFWNQQVPVEAGVNGPGSTAPETAVAKPLESDEHSTAGSAFVPSPIARDQLASASKPSAPLEPDSGPLLRVVVRDKETRAPVTGATVRIVSGSTSNLSPSESAQWLELLPDWERVAERFGASAISDAGGIALLPAPVRSEPDDARRGNPPWIVARKDDRYAETSVTLPLQGADEVTLALDRDLFARVLVVDGTGRPQAGVAVGLVMAARPDGGSPNLASQWRTRAPDGIATLSHLQSIRARAGLIVRCVSPALLGSTLPLDPAHPPAEVLTLTVQSSGSLAVVLRGNLERGDQVRLRITGERNQSSSTQRFESDSGRAMFSRVGLGASFQVAVERAGTTLVRREVVGPRSADEVVECVFDLDKDCGHLLARILDPEGKPLRVTTLRTELADRRSRFVTQRLTTDDEGRVRVPIATDFAKQALSWVRFAVADSKSALAASPPTPVTWNSGDLDLGDLRCAQAPLLVAGRLIDEDGKPVEGGELGLTTSPPASDGQQRMEWLRLLSPPNADLVTIRNHDGTFAIRGTMPKERARVLARHPQYVACPPLEFTVGEQDLAVVLTRGAEVRTLVLCSDAKTATSIQLILKAASSGQNGGLVASRTPLLDAPTTSRFGWSRVPAGTYELQVRSNSTGELLHSLQGIEIPRSGTASDSRLAEIDLRTVTQSYTLKLVDATGAKVSAWGGASFETQAGRRSAQISDGTVSFTSNARGLEVTIQSQGMRTQTVHCEPGETTICRKPGIPVVVTCAALAALRGRDQSAATLQAIRTRRGDQAESPWNGDWGWGDSAEIGKDGTCRFTLSDPGSYKFGVYSYSPTDNEADSQLGEFEPAALEVKDDPNPQTFVVNLSAAGKAKLDAWAAKNRK